jgi:hypothetical protein
MGQEAGDVGRVKRPDPGTQVFHLLGHKALQRAFLAAFGRAPAGDADELAEFFEIGFLEVFTESDHVIHAHWTIALIYGKEPRSVPRASVIAAG